MLSKIPFHLMIFHVFFAVIAIDALPFAYIVNLLAIAFFTLGTTITYYHFFDKHKTPSEVILTGYSIYIAVIEAIIDSIEQAFLAIPIAIVVGYTLSALFTLLDKKINKE